MKKRLTAIILVLSVILSLGGCGNKEEESDGNVTRGQWISMLAEKFGMDHYQESAPYYTDVGTDSELFSYVQSAYEWDVLSPYAASDTFDAGKWVTGEEVVASAAIAAGCAVSENQFASDGSYDCAFAVSYAVEHQIIGSSTNLPKRMTQEECEEILEAAQIAYMTPSAEESTVAEYSEDVKQLDEASVENWQFDNDTVFIPKGNGNVSLSGGSAQSPANEPGAELPEDAQDHESGATQEEANQDGLTAILETENGTAEIGVGEVFVTAPTEENPSGVAYKVTSIHEADGDIVLTTETPTLEDLYEELNVHTTVAADLSRIIWAPGVSSSSNATSTNANEGEYQVRFLGAYTQDVHAEFLDKEYSTSYTKNFSFGNGSPQKERSSNSAVLGGGKGAQAFENSSFVYDKTPSIEDFGGETNPWTENLQAENQFQGGYKITGTISINSLTVRTDIDYLKTRVLKIPYGIDTAAITVNSDISSTLTLEGTLSEKLKIAVIPIPIAATGLNVCIDLYLYADASGCLTVQAGLGASAKVEYSGGRIKNTASSNASASVEAAVELDFGAELTATLDALGIVKIMDAGVKAGGTLTASAYVGGTCDVTEEDGITTMAYKESMNIKADLYVPIVSVSVGGSDTLIGSLGLSNTWNIITMDGAKHFELLNEEWVFWEETVTVGENGEIIDSETTTAGPTEEVGPSEDDRLDLDTYTLTITGESAQLNLIVPEGQAQTVVWSSDNPSVATVDNNGVVSPVSTGYAIITASLADNPNIYVKCAVYVEEIGEENWQFLPADISYQI